MHRAGVAKTRPYWSRAGSYSNVTAVFVWGEDRDADTQGELHVTMETEIGAMHLQAKKG